MPCDPRTALRALELAALIILENGGETYRVEETVRHMGEGFGLSEVNAVCTVTGLFLSLETGGEQFTSVRRVKRRTNNFWRVDVANAISRQVAEGALHPSEAVKQLEIVRTSLAVNGRVMLLASGLAAAFFAWMFGGGALEFGLAFMCGILVHFMGGQLRRLDMYMVIQNLVGGALCALFAVLGNRLLGTSVEAVIAGALMPLLPGVAMTNAMRDMMRGDMLSSVTRLVEALLIAGLLAAGVAIILRAGLALFGGFV